MNETLKELIQKLDEHSKYNLVEELVENLPRRRVYSLCELIPQEVLVEVLENQGCKVTQDE